MRRLPPEPKRSPDRLPQPSAEGGRQPFAQRQETARHLEELRKRHPDAEVLQQGSSYKLCLIAEGSVDYYPRTTETYEWDTAAGESIIALAGGSIYSLDDTAPLRYNKESLVNPASPAAANGSVTEPRQSPSQPYGDVPSGTSPYLIPVSATVQPFRFRPAPTITGPPPPVSVRANSFRNRRRTQYRTTRSPIRRVRASPE